MTRCPSSVSCYSCVHAMNMQAECESHQEIQKKSQVSHMSVKFELSCTVSCLKQKRDTYLAKATGNLRERDLFTIFIFYALCMCTNSTLGGEGKIVCTV